MSAAPGIQGGHDAAPGILPPGAGYERWAPSYDHTPNPLLALEERELVPLLPRVHRKSVLDLCCGTGRWLRILRTYHPAFMTGVDSSAAMLDIARRSFSQLVRADCRQLPFAEAVFDFVICSFAVGHLPELAAFARECARILKPRGSIFVTDLHPEAYAMGWRTSFRDDKGAAEIRTVSHSWRDSVHLFGSLGLACAGIKEFRFATPEETIFRKAGKSAYFFEASRRPAVLLGCFWRIR